MVLMQLQSCIFATSSTILPFVWKVNGTNVKLPMTAAPGVTVSLKGKHYTVAMDFGVTVRYDGNHFMDIKVIKEWVKDWTNRQRWDLGVATIKLHSFGDREHASLTSCCHLHKSLTGTSSVSDLQLWRSAVWTLWRLWPKLQGRLPKTRRIVG